MLNVNATSPYESIRVDIEYVNKVIKRAKGGSCNKLGSLDIIFISEWLRSGIRSTTRLIQTVDTLNGRTLYGQFYLKDVPEIIKELQKRKRSHTSARQISSFTALKNVVILKKYAALEVISVRLQSIKKQEEKQ